MKKTKKNINAAILIIGNEVLSGRTQDLNVSFISHWLNINCGISVEEVRIIPDIEKKIIFNVLDLSKKFKYVFTTGGIGPTHDDITSLSISKAFKAKYGFNKEAYLILEKYYGKNNFNEGRKKMARMPVGATLIYNEQGSAPAFFLENVFVLPGIPSYVEIMLPQLKNILIHGKKIVSISYDAKVRESSIAISLSQIQDMHQDLDIGSYPYSKENSFGTVLIVRGVDKLRIESCISDIKSMLKKYEDLN